ncbi:expressed unknown protein [Seminavis robusta]|uniref:Uncharacterized protein n=1 Tax=Seminavis robusta TaxID=568900 RepID=A0A9N8EEA5_9STRA|nr:expressed unknown protein [Seminavis robusta]|eukprot:Sro1026_g232880.1 n/a (263) ;mRNA; r:16554-17342
MKIPRIYQWLLPLFVILLAFSASSASTEDEDEQLLRETIAAGRGHRDEQGVRDQWASSEHLKDKFDSRRKPVSPRVRALLESYRLECKGCDESEAVAKINAFVKETKQQVEDQAKRQRWLERAAMLVTVVVLGGLAYQYSIGAFDAGGGSSGYSIGGRPSDWMGQARRLQIEEQRQRAAKKEEEAAKILAAAQAKEAPTWRENEEKEVWTAKQERQFAKALVSFGGVPPKGRYTLIANKVDDKSRQECLMHHKLLQLIAKEQ